MNEKQRQLAAENHNLIYSFLIKHGYDYEDFYDVAAIGLCKAAMTYKKSIGMFSTYAYTCMLNEIRHYFKIQDAQRRIPKNLISHYNKKTYTESGKEIGEALDYMACYDCFENDVIFELCVEKVKERMSDRDKLIFDMLLDGYTTREIGKAAGCSCVHITNIRRNMRGKFNWILK